MKTIYIVEDSEIISGLLKKVITNMPGVTVHTFANGEAMLKRIKNEKPDLIFLDYYLDEDKSGHMNGSEVFLNIRAQNPNVPVVLLTGMSDKGKMKRLKLIGFEEVLHKDGEDIFRDVERCAYRYLN